MKFSLPLLALFTACAGHSQTLVSRLPPSELQLLDSAAKDSRLPCRVDRSAPELGLDLRFHAGYRMVFPILLGEADRRLRVVMRITPEADTGGAQFFADYPAVPDVGTARRTNLALEGHFTVGPGSYRVDWAARDDDDRVCSAHWEINARLRGDFARVQLALPPNTVDADPDDPFRDSPPVARDSNHPLSVKILVSFSTGDPANSAVRPRDVEAVTSIVRSISRQRRFGNFSLVVFSVEEQRVLYRSNPDPKIDFAAMKKAANNRALGTVDYHQLQHPASTRNFLIELLSQQTGETEAPADAVIIVSPRLVIGDRLSREVLEHAKQSACPVFYLSYLPEPVRNPWRDSIAKAIQAYRGLEYPIAAAADLGSAVGDMMARLDNPR